MRFITTRKVALFQENITCYRAPSQEDFIEGAFCRDWYLVELEKVPAISNILCRFYDILKNQKTTGLYMHTDISRTVMNFLG